jgi:hypothetical protein
VGVEIKKFSVKLAYEQLEGDGVYAFQTPLATGHAFNGWTDQFLTTPANGLEDTFLTVGANLAGMKLLGVYHDFSAHEGGEDYGTELNLLITKTFKEMYTTALKYASYSADSDTPTLPFVVPVPNTDTDKLWVTLQVKF